MALDSNKIDEILNLVQQDGVSDIHVSANNKVRVRKKGQVETIGTEILSSDDVLELIQSTMNDKQKQEFSGVLEYDYAFEYKDICRYRANAFNNISGNCLVLRQIPKKIPALEEINAPAIFKKFTQLHQGLVLVTGATGSGKSTTLAAMINEINKTQKKHIITVEDPTEFVYQSELSLINQREVGRSTASFPAALRAALREDPDIILVGEMRDRETVELALEAAETGHTVFSTLHTNNAYDAVNRIIDMFPQEAKSMATSLLSGALAGVISQRLEIKVDGSGRYPLHEILVSTDAVKNLIREGNIPQILSMMQVGQRFGMQTMLDSANKAVRSGIIDNKILEVLQPNKENHD